MWTDQQVRLQMRRDRLLVRSQALREQLSGQSQALQSPLALADRAHHAVQWLAAHPGWLAGLVALPLVLRPRRALGWGLKLWGAWRLWRQLQALLPRQASATQPPWNPSAR
jgi:hypothetical protein